MLGFRVGGVGGVVGGGGGRRGGGGGRAITLSDDGEEGVVEDVSVVM